jgi:hypothetical protein
MCFEGSELSWCALEQNSTYSMQLELFWLEVQSVFIRVHPRYAVADLRHLRSSAANFLHIT